MKYFCVQFTNDIELKYQLIEHAIVTQWIDLIKIRTIDECCTNNHYIGYNSVELIDDKIKKLYFLSDKINNRVPNRVIKQEINKENWQTALQIMHVHFPDLKNDENYKDIWDDLTEYNDIIHWLESTLPDKSNISKFFRITLDFNKHYKTNFLDIPEDAFNLFNPFTNFGYLLLHYTHVGKNAHELFVTNDLICPSEQFIPQTKFSASVRMYFTDNFHYTEQSQKIYLDRWEKFYYKLDNNFWKYKIDNPKIAFGFIKIGQLKFVNNETAPIEPMSILKLRQKLIKSKILFWAVKEG